MYLIGQIVICYLIADFITGFFHWIEDTYGVPSWPFIGKSVIVDNINHHKNPSMAGYMGGILSRSWVTFLLAIIVILISCLIGLFHWTLLLVAFFALLGNEVHNWNHDLIRHPIIDLLRDSSIIQSKKHHAIHHVPPYNKNFCTLSNFLNPTLEYIKFWEKLESILSKIGIKSKRMSEDRDGY